MKDLTNEIMSEIEMDALFRLKADPIMMEAVKKYVLAVVYKQGVINAGKEFKGGLNFALNLAWGATNGHGHPIQNTPTVDDAILGQNLRALTYATQLVESGFKDISDLDKPEEIKEEVINKAE